MHTGKKGTVTLSSCIEYGIPNHNSDKVKQEIIITKTIS